jgi:hypothetical protein
MIWVTKDKEISPKLEPFDSVYLPVIRAVEISLGGPDMGMTQQILDGLEIGSFIQKSGGKGVAHDVGVDPIPD